MHLYLYNIIYYVGMYIVDSNILYLVTQLDTNLEGWYIYNIFVIFHINYFTLIDN